MSDQQLPDFGSIMQQAAALQEQLAQAREEAAEQILTGQAANGAVSIDVTGNGEFRSVHIDPSLTEDVDMLEDLVLAALRDAMTKIETLQQEAVAGLGGLFDTSGD